MDKSTMVSNVAAATGYTKSSVGEIIDAYLDELRDQIVNAGELRIHHLGTFKVVKRKARTYVHRLGPGGVPMPPTKRTVPAKNAITFRAASNMKEAVNSK